MADPKGQGSHHACQHQDGGVCGIDTIPVEVQVHLTNGLPAMAIVGLADKAVAESRERVRAALASMGWRFRQSGSPSILRLPMSSRKARISTSP